jgi:hypothetical protein
VTSEDLAALMWQIANHSKNGGQRLLRNNNPLKRGTPIGDIYRLHVWQEINRGSSFALEPIARFVFGHLIEVRLEGADYLSLCDTHVDQLLVDVLEQFLRIVSVSCVPEQQTKQFALESDGLFEESMLSACVGFHLTNPRGFGRTARVGAAGRARSHQSHARRARSRADPQF